MTYGVLLSAACSLATQHASLPLHALTTWCRSWGSHSRSRATWSSGGPAAQWEEHRHSRQQAGMAMQRMRRGRRCKLGLRCTAHLPERSAALLVLGAGAALAAARWAGLEDWRPLLLGGQGHHLGVAGRHLQVGVRGGGLQCPRLFETAVRVGQQQLQRCCAGKPSRLLRRPGAELAALHRPHLFHCHVARLHRLVPAETMASTGVC